MSEGERPVGAERPVVRLTAATGHVRAEVPAPPGPRPPGHPRRRLVPLLAGCGLLVAAVASQRGGPDPAATAAPAPTVGPSVTPSTAPALPRAPVADLRTTVSVGHVRAPGRTVPRQIEVVARTLTSAGILASFGYAPEPAAHPTGVRVSFDRRLTDKDAAAFVAALAQLPGATAELTTAPGIVVDVSVPLGRAAPCAPGAGHGLVLPPRDMDAVGRVFPTFGLVTSRTHATVLYHGPARTRAQLHSVGAVLARACGAAADSPTYTRGAQF